MAGINSQGIPKEIIAFSQWVNWRAEKKDNGKITKIPICSKTGRKASHSDEKTWSSYQDALSRYNKGKVSGIGFVFSKNDPFCAIDLDSKPEKNIKCRDVSSGKIEPWAKEIIRKFNSWCEISPSGTGVHIICRGKLPAGGRKRPDIEIYDTERYFTVTGNHLAGTPKDIRPAQNAIDWLLAKYFKKKVAPQAPASSSSPRPSLSESELIQKAIESKNGHKFNLLNQGQWEEAGYPSQSEADLSLCNLLAFWNGRDPGRMDAMFRQSGLMRPKWDERHSGDGQTYGQVTIDTAISNCRETYSGKLAPITIEDIESGRAHTGQASTQNDTTPTEKSSFDIAKEQYPRTPFPWDVLPDSISSSLQQLARSCATSSTSLPGAAIAIFASTFGDTANVYPKKSWREPFIFWCGDIRPSGEGKTPPPRSLMHVLYEAQRMANDAYKTALELWEILPKQKRGKPPDKPRGFFVTDLTLEGLRVDHSGHGGKVCVLDELSSFLTSQNQYKNKGSDRESWLCLHDGNDARIVRAKETLTLTGCRISVFGGIQPEVWQRIFSENDGLHLVDGTIFRFLPTYEGRSYYPLTKESWSDDNRASWESLLRDALSWADNQEKSKSLVLSDDAQEIFFEWRNDLFQTKDDLPPQVGGFIPKLVGYALRFAGVLYLMHRFSQGHEIGGLIHRDYIERGIRVSEFYLGHIICAMEALAGDASSPLEFTEQVIHLAKTLKSLKPELDSGRLAVGYIHEKFNETCQPEQKIRTARAMGALIRKCELTISGDRFDANGRRGVFCLQWDEKTKYFIEISPQSPQSSQAKEYQGSQPADIEKLKSAKSASADVNGDDLRTLRTLKKQSPQPVTGTNTNNTDITDITDEFSKEIKNNEFEDLGAGCSDVDEEVL